MTLVVGYSREEILIEFIKYMRVSIESMASEMVETIKPKTHSFQLNPEDEAVVFENLTMKKWESKSHMYREAIRVLNKSLKQEATA